ncbi:MAG: ABC transporter permease [Acidiferrobacterales bacterium]|nr:ABC transporter permease [Acidiferrobacterales bacterium]
MATTADAPLTTVDGTPLKVSLARALRRDKIKSMLLVAPLLVFITLTFVIPIGDMLLRGVEDPIVSSYLPKTAAELENWDATSGELPGENVFEALVMDIKAGAPDRVITRVGKRLNYEQPGMSSLFRKSQRRIPKLEEGGPYKDAVIKVDKKWGQLTTWQLIKTFSPTFTAGYFWAALDLQVTPSGDVEFQDEKKRIYLKLFLRTLYLSGVITLMTLILGYPVAYLLATLPLKSSNILLMLVLLPFWTSLLVRTTSWIALLQREGVINDLLVGLNLIDSENRLGMIHNATGTIIAMTHILLPFMILPLYSVMKTIPPSYMRAAVSLGAHPASAFFKVYAPNTIPGIGAGGILVFILAIGYYITPALVGGTSGTFISNFIAYHVSVSLNWGLAAALGIILLGLVLVLYLLYDKIVGIDNMKLG